jgi:hypothetical protein
MKQHPTLSGQEQLQYAPASVGIAAAQDIIVNTAPYESRTEYQPKRWSGDVSALA